MEDCKELQSYNNGTGNLDIEDIQIQKNLTEFLNETLKLDDGDDLQSKDVVLLTSCANIHVGDIVHVDGPIELTTVVQNFVRDGAAPQNLQAASSTTQDSSSSGDAGENKGLDEDESVTEASRKICFVSRSAWMADPPLTTTPLPDQLQYVIIGHTASEKCDSMAQNILQVQYMQDIHMRQRGWWDIAYNFMIGGDGNIYEGRGWDHVSSHTLGYNEKSFSIAIIGTFNERAPTNGQLRATLSLIEMAVARGKIVKDYKIIGHCQVRPSESPGKFAMNIIKTWPHWSPEGPYCHEIL